MATTRPLVVITTAAPEVAPRSPWLQALWIAPARIFWTSACSGALMLVTRSSPALAGVWLTVPVTTPWALTRTRWMPGRAAQLPVVLLLEPGLADQVHAGEAGHGQVPLLDLLRGDGLQVAEHLGRVGAVRAADRSPPAGPAR